MRHRWEKDFGGWGVYFDMSFLRWICLPFRLIYSSSCCLLHSCSLSFLQLCFLFSFQPAYSLPSPVSPSPFVHWWFQICCRGLWWHWSGWGWCLFFFFLCILFRDFPSASVGKESACNARDTGDPGSTPGSGRSSGGGNGNPLQYSCLENTMDRGAWHAI